MKTSSPLLITTLTNPLEPPLQRQSIAMGRKSRQRLSPTTFCKLRKPTAFLNFHKNV